jgi:hypothetical protein
MEELRQIVLCQVESGLIRHLLGCLHRLVHGQRFVRLKQRDIPSHLFHFNINFSGQLALRLKLERFAFFHF